MNSRILYKYRDGANYKFPGAAVLAGTVTKEEIRPHLHEGTYFIPGDVGLASLHPTHCTFDEDLDHPWHELEEVTTTEGSPSTDLSARDFLRLVQEAARAGAARGLLLGVRRMTFFTLAVALIATLVNLCYLREMTRARSRSLADLLLLVAFDAGLVWIVAARASARPGF